MGRKYELKERAKRQDETRRRIVEAAVELHGTIGPLATTVSAIAERAGVQRHTYYRHFPDERSLGLACSGLYAEQNPLPDPEPWRALADPKRRLRRGLGELYEYFERNERMLANVNRDGELDPLTRELSELRFGPGLAAIRGVLAEALPRGRDADLSLDLALDFNTWRLLARNGSSSSRAAELMASVVTCMTT
jgi:AcrR family transcriptional regulator